MADGTLLSGTSTEAQLRAALRGHVVQPLVLYSIYIYNMYIPYTICRIGPAYIVCMICIYNMYVNMYVSGGALLLEKG